MSKTKEARERKPDFLKKKKHLNSCPLNFYMEFKYRSKISANNDYHLLNQLDIRKNCYARNYDDDWSHYHDEKDTVSCFCLI